jgi:hypothetical protein
MTRRLILGLLAVMLFSASQAHAQTQGIVIKGKETRNGQSLVIEVRLDKQHVRTDVTVAGNRESTIFDSMKPLLVALSLSRNTYIEFSKAEMDRYKAAMDRVITDSIRRAIPNPTPEQQARIDESQRARNTASTAVHPVREFFPFSKDKVGDWPCTNYAPPGGTIICTADPTLFGLSSEDFEALRQLEQFELVLSAGIAPLGRSMTISPASDLFVSGISEGKPFAGIVLKRLTQGSTPALASVFEVTEIRRETLPPGLFEIPSGLTKQSLSIPGTPR